MGNAVGASQAEIEQLLGVLEAARKAKNSSDQPVLLNVGSTPDTAGRKSPAVGSSHVNSSKRRKSESVEPSAEKRWAEVRDLRNTYLSRVVSILLGLGKGEYDQSLKEYWDILYFSGFDEQWRWRLELSNKLYEVALLRRQKRDAAWILLKGISYPFIEFGLFGLGEATLLEALRLFPKSDRRGRGLCFRYLADLHGNAGDLEGALKMADDASLLLQGADLEEITLEKDFAKARAASLLSPSRHESMEALEVGLGKIESPRHGLVTLEMAKGLLARGMTDEALAACQRATVFFTQKIHMPRNARKAQALMEDIKGAQNLPKPPL